MFRSSVLLGVWLCAALPGALFAQEPLGTPPQPAPTVQLIRITGNREFSERAVLDKVRIAPGQPLSETAEHVAQRLERDYRDEGYAFARVKAEFDPASGHAHADD